MGIYLSEETEKIIEKIRKGGIEQCVVLSDFDKTLTRGKINGESGKSLISFLRDGEYLDPEYNKKAKDLFAKYYPVEIDTTIDTSTKFEAMNDWRTDHFDVLMQYGLSKDILDRVIAENKVHFAKGIEKFTYILYKKNIPLVIISAGIEYLINGFLKKYGLNFSNISVIANHFDFDKRGKFIGVETIIHGMNKYILESKQILSDVAFKGRKNCIVLGDSPSDIGMSVGGNYDTILNIGFCHFPEQENLFKDIFDVVLFDDEGLNFVVELIEKL